MLKKAGDKIRCCEKVHEEGELTLRRMHKIKGEIKELQEKIKKKINERRIK
jgi:hypothetical protein